MKIFAEAAKQTLIIQLTRLTIINCKKIDQFNWSSLMQRRGAHSFRRSNWWFTRRVFVSSVLESFLFTFTWRHRWTSLPWEEQETARFHYIRSPRQSPSRKRIEWKCIDSTRSNLQLDERAAMWSSLSFCGDDVENHKRKRVNAHIDLNVHIADGRGELRQIYDNVEDDRAVLHLTRRVNHSSTFSCFIDPSCAQWKERH